MSPPAMWHPTDLNARCAASFEREAHEEWFIGCFESEDDPPYWETDDPRYDRLTIVAPEGLWISHELTCRTRVRESTITTDERDEQTDLEELARRELRGLRPDDLFQKPGYPGTEWPFETRVVVRDGERVARFHFPYSRTWDIIVHACPGSGIGT